VADLSESLDSYVPLLIRRRLAANPTPLAQAVAEPFPAAVLLADISGFTALAERLAGRGPSGSEELSRLLNTFFGQLINLISQQGGDILKFAGDAMLAVWPANDEAVGLQAPALQLAVRRAAQCALAIQSQAGGQAQEIQLTLRIGIGVGEVVTAHLGGQRNRWELVVAGDPLVQMSMAKQQAQPGEVILSPEAWAMYGGQPSGKNGQLGIRLATPPDPSLPLRAASPIQLPESALAALKSYIPGAIVARLAAGQGVADWLAELRRVTVLFVNLPELAHDLPLERAQALTQAIQDTVYHFEGSLNKLSVDDKGVTLLAAFGLPPLAHEDDAARGVQAALKIQRALQLLGFKTSTVGIATGRVFCGVIGNTIRREYTMIGDVVNLAARLMEAQAADLASPTRVLCDQATYQAARHEVEFESLAPLNVRGKSEPILTFRPVSTVVATAESGANSQLVGRQSERVTLLNHLQALQQGESSVVVIEGEAGIGKSRLIEDLIEQSRALKVVALLGTGDAIEKATPYQAWRPIFSHIFGGGNDINTLREQVLKLLETRSELIDLAPLLNTLLPLDLLDNELTEAMTGQVRAENLRNLLIEILKIHSGGAPLLVAIEDAHWLDSASWTFMLTLIQNVQPLFLAVAARPPSEPPPIEYAQLLDTPGLQRMVLEPLSGSDTITLVCQRLKVKALPEGVSRLIRAKAEGHPFFSEELAYALRDSGTLIVENEQCRLAPGVSLDTIKFPDTVQGAIISRIDRLAPPLQLTLKTASVIGRIFAERVLRDIHPIDSDKPKLNEYLNTLARLDITPLESLEPELTYIFKHVITHEVTYELLLYAQRQQLHRAVAEWHERTYADDLSPFYPLVAYHWSRAIGSDKPDPFVAAKALEYLGRAGEHALSSFANREAAQFFEQAIQLARSNQSDFSIQRQARWERLLGEAHFRLGDLVESKTHTEQSLKLQHAPIADSPGLTLLRLVGQALIQVVHRLIATRPAQPTVAAMLLEQVRAYERLGEIAYYSSQIVPGLYVGLKTLNLAEQAGLSPELARAYGSMCVAANIISWDWLADEYARRAQATAEAVNDLAALIWVLTTTSIHTIVTGQWKRAQAALERSAEIAERIGDRRIFEGDLAALAHVSHHRGEFARSQQLWEQLTESAKRYGNDQTQAWGLLGSAENVLRLAGEDRAEQAIQLVQEALPLLAKGVDRAEQTRAYGTLALGQFRLGNFEAALTAVKQAVELAYDLQFTSYGTFGGYFNVAEATLLLAESRPDSKSILLELSAKTLIGLKRFASSFPIGRPRALLWEGLDSWLRGNRSKATQLWQRGLSIAEKMGMPYEIALAEYEIGRHASGTQRLGRLARARSLFENCGAAMPEINE
jgi:class 3 adenylate cyclase/tetratricopeptide (TPR) repeat protein